MGVLPVAAAERIEREARADLYDLDELRTGVTETQHPLVPLVRALAERCGDARGFVHWGATTQDVLDTGLILQVRAALGPIRRDLRRSTIAAAALALKHRSLPMAGRTHGQHAVPITFGLKAATWADELGRARDRLSQTADAALVAQLSGAAGTFATLGDAAGPVQEAFARRLGLGRAGVHWHATRDRLRDLAHALAGIGGAAERVASEVVRLQSTEIAEVAEPSSDAHVGSSTMPQKRNPMTCEYIVAGARLLRGQVAVITDSPAHAYERDMGLWAAEWIALPEAFVLCAGVVAKLASVLSDLEVDKARMRENLDLTRGQIMAEAVMMRLGAAMGHEPAHALVLSASRRASAEGRDLIDVLAEDPEVASSLTAVELERLMDPTSYLGLSARSARVIGGEGSRVEL